MQVNNLPDHYITTIILARLIGTLKYGNFVFITGQLHRFMSSIVHKLAVWS